MNKCVFSGSTENLNTSFTVTLDDGEKVTLYISDEYADEATPKAAKEAYLASKAKQDMDLQKLIDQAKEMGFDISEGNGGLVIAQAKPKEDKPQLQPQEIKKKEPEPVEEGATPPAIPTLEIGDNVEDRDEMIISKDKYDAVSAGLTRSAAAVDGGPALEQHGGLTKPEGLSEEATKGKVKMMVAEGRGGNPIAIPSKISDGTGTTRITINKSSDRELQDRFKQMSEEAQYSSKSPFSTYQDDNTRACPLCQGEQTIQGQTCPKCKGEGFITVR